MAEPLKRPRLRLTSPKADDVQPSEFQSQCVVFDWARLHERKYPALQWMFAVPNGGKRDYVTAAKLKAAGTKIGVLDYFLPAAFGGFIGLAIEQKRKGERPTPSQAEWITGLAGLGWQTNVCYSATEAIQVLQHYVSAPKTMIVPPYAVDIPF